MSHHVGIDFGYRDSVCVWHIDRETGTITLRNTYTLPGIRWPKRYKRRLRMARKRRRGA